MAIIGTAFISSSRTDRYSAVQHNTNTQADLLLQGLVNTLDASIASNVYGTTTVPGAAVSTGYRPPSQEFPTPAAAVANDGSGGEAEYNFYNFDGVGNATRLDPTVIAGYNVQPLDLFLGSRAAVIPDLVPANLAVAWPSVSWPLFPQVQGTYGIGDSPFSADGSGVPQYALNRSVIQQFVAYKTETDGSIYPGFIYYIPANTTLYNTDGTASSATGADQYLTPSGSLPGPITAANYNQYVTLAADADGDGIADAPLFKLPVGQIEGITYYGAVRVVDNNSAVNASTAWQAVQDDGAPAVQSSDAGLNFGFFRSGLGLYELLDPSNSANELNALNTYRYKGFEGAPTATVPGLNIAQPYSDGGTARSDFQFFSYGDMLDSQLARRGLNPGNNTSTVPFVWLGNAETAAMAHRGVLIGSSTNKSVLETTLPNETFGFSGATPTPYAASMFYGGSTSYWFNANYQINSNANNPLATAPEPSSMRPLLVGSNPVANAVPARFGNTNAIPTFAPASIYQFGDLAKGSDGYVYTSLVANNNTNKLKATAPIAALPITTADNSLTTNDPTINTGQITAGVAVYENPFWARVPWSSTPVKASANTATFEQLWLAFCQVMTDSVTPINGTSTTFPLWQPPLTAPGTPAAMFRSCIRDNRALANTWLTPMQMMQIRAALAAVNTIDLRSSGDDVSSRHIVLDDDTPADINYGSPLYDVEVYGTKKQPYISEALAVVNKPADNTKNYLALELVNPYSTPIVISTSWKFASLNRTTTGAASGPPALALATIGSLATNLVIPAAIANKPGRAYILGTPANAPEGFVASIVAGASVTINGDQVNASAISPYVKPPTGTATITGTNLATLAGLEQVLGNELVILKPRKADTPVRDNLATKELSISSDPYDSYDETVNVADLVPVDQIDFTGTQSADATAEPAPFGLHYRRGDNPTAAPSYAWNCIYPGPYATTSKGDVVAGTLPFREAFQVESAPTPITLGFFTDPKAGVPAAASPTPTFYTAPIDLANVGMGGLNPQVALIPTGGVAAGTSFTYSTKVPNVFPFGGFARNVDLQQIPFIGAYRVRPYTNPGITNPSASVTELNSVSMDCTTAFDNTAGFAVQQPLNAVTAVPELTPEGATANLPVPIATDATVTAFGATRYEQIGRFCPVGNTGAGAAAANPTMQVTNTMVTGTQTLDYIDLSSTTAMAYSNWHYHWAKKLFDYVTVQAPGDDYFPNVDPRPDFGSSYLGATSASHNPTDLSPYIPYQLVAADQPQAVANRKAAVANATANGSEDTVPVEGLININTAPLSVLSTLPFVPRGTDVLTYIAPTSYNSIGAAGLSLTGTKDGVDDNAEIAHAIVAYRNVFGPFKSIEDLYRVPAFALMNQYLVEGADAAHPEPISEEGYFIADRPVAGVGGGWSNAAYLGSDSPRFDFAEKNLLLDHLSNLITTRSDSFTCYVLLQGWRNAGTSRPQLAVQRRAAYIVDRCGVTPLNSQMTTFPISQN